MILWRLRVQFAILIPLPKTFSPSTVNVRSELWKFFKKKEIFQMFDILFDLTRRRLQFSILISLLKSFSPSTVNVRSKFWRIWKKENFQKFDILIDLLRRRLQFSILISLPKNFSPNFKISFFLSYFTSNTNISKRLQIYT